MSPLPRLAAPLAAPALLLLAACSRAPEPGAPGGDPGSGKPAASDEAGDDTLVIALQSDIDTFIDVVSQEVTNGAVIDNMFGGLLGTDFDCRPLHPPEHAERFEVADDQLSITYHLRRDLKWSDGKPFTARDVLFTYDLIADPAVASPRVSYTQHLLPSPQLGKPGPEMVDDHTVRFRFTHAYDRNTQISHTASMNIMPEHALKDEPRGSLRGAAFDKSPVVSGPWKLVKHDKNALLVLGRNEGYTGPHRAKLARVIFKVVPEYATRLIELENGSVDMIENIQNMEDVARLKKTHPELKMYRRGWRFMDYVAWNTRSPLFEKKEVRQALTMAIDRRKIIKDLLTTEDGEEYGREAVSWITPELCDYRLDDEIQPFPFDPEKAKAALAAQGFKDGDGDGILERDGKPFRFVLLTNSGNARRAKAVIIVQANLRAIGVDAQLEQVEGNTFFERLRKKDYEAALSGWSAGLFVDPIELWHSDTPERKYEFNFTSYSNPKADELMERGMKTADPKDAAPIWKDLQKQIYDDQPYTFLYWRDEVVPLHERFRGAQVDLLSSIHNLHAWWVPKDKVKYRM